MAKLTESYLRKIIKEELNKAIKESDGYGIFKQEPPTGTTQLSNDEIAVLVIIGELMSSGSDITQSAIQRHYRTVAGRSNQRHYRTVAGRSNGTVDSKKFQQSLMSLVNKKFVERDEFGFSTTAEGDNEIRNIGNHPVTKFLYR